jgi:hypothetical protein
VIATFPAAPLDRTSGWITSGLWCLSIALALGGAGALAFSVPIAGIPLVAAGVVDGAILLWARPRQAVAYELDENALIVRRRKAEPKQFAGPIASPRRGRLGIRIAGNGGVYGYSGKFRAEKKTVSAFVTSTADVVLVRVGESELAISPADPDAFIATAGAEHA